MNATLYFITIRYQMKSLYKYSTYRKGYFDNPTLRITQRNALNDPFESLPPVREVQEFFEMNLREDIR